jgi:hypothetical protein
VCLKVRECVLVSSCTRIFMDMRSKPPLDGHHSQSMTVNRRVRWLKADAHHAGGCVFTHVDALGLEQRPHLLEGGDLQGAQQEAGSGCGCSVQ